MNHQFIKSLKFRLINKILFNLKDKQTTIRKILMSGYYILSNLKFLIEKQFLLLKTRLMYGKLYFKKVYWVNPENLQYFSEIRVDKWKNYNRILNGDWDIPKTSFENSVFYQGFKERFKEGKNWELTKYYQLELSKGNVKELDVNKKRTDEKFRKLEKLYYEIKKDGIRLKRELSISKGWFARIDIRTSLDDISVDIGRDGQLLISHGKNRLSIVKILNFPKVPITIIIRHKKWMDFRRKLMQNFRIHQSGKFDNVLTHPDLQNIPFKKGDIPFDIIKKNIYGSKGTLLDIGARTGYFCLKFEDEGFDCYAAEENPEYIYLLKKIKKAENKQFKIITKSILDYNINQELNFDIVLVLNGFHHYLKTKESYLKFIEFIKRLKVKELILSSPNLKEIQNQNTYRNFNSNHIINLISENSFLSDVKLLGKTKTGRVVYKLFSET